MEVRHRRLLLTLLLVLLSIQLAWAEDPLNTSEELKPVIQPEVERTDFDEARIDTENFEITAFFGLMTIEDFGTNAVYGARAAYHITEELFIEGAIGTTEGGETSYEVITGGAPLLTDDERSLLYYNASLGFNILPGEAFVTRNLTFNNDLYLIAGIGSTDFAGEDRLTINFGAGYRLYIRDYFAIRADFRDHVFNMNVISADKLTHNPEFTLGASFFF
jgi:outer membrane beta-barrel protein